MANLSHTTKVAVRRAIKALQTLYVEEAIYLDDPNRDQSPDSPNIGLLFSKIEENIAKKAGFTSRAKLEAYARKHHLM